MFGPFALWAPEYNLPLSGNVDQDILLGAVSNRIAGVPEIERQVVTEVASYGDQLSTILDALEALAVNAKLDLPEVKELQTRIDEVKTNSRDVLRAQAERAMARLKDADQEAWKALRQD